MKKVSYRGCVRVKRRLIVADEGKDDSGFSWTLAAALGDMLLCAEEKFGPRDKSYTLLGIDFSPSGSRTWTPGNCGHMIIHLDMNCLIDRHDAYRQRALADRQSRCERFGSEQWYMNRIFGEGWWSSGPANAPDYYHALVAAEELLARDPDIVKKIREHQPVIARITAEQIREHCPAAPGNLCQALAETFTTLAA